MFTIFSLLKQFSGRVLKNTKTQNRNPVPPSTTQHTSQTSRNIPREDDFTPDEELQDLYIDDDQPSTSRRAGFSSKDTTKSRKRPHSDKPKKDKKKKKARHTFIKDPSPSRERAAALEREVDNLHRVQHLTPNCSEESMLPAAVKQREEDFEAACAFGMYFITNLLIQCLKIQHTFYAPPIRHIPAAFPLFAPDPQRNPPPVGALIIPISLIYLFSASLH